MIDADVSAARLFKNLLATVCSGSSPIRLWECKRADSSSANLIATVIVPKNILNTYFTCLATGFTNVNYLPLLLMPLKSEKAAQLLLTEKVTITVV